MKRTLRYISFVLAGATSIVCFDGLLIENPAAAEPVEALSAERASLEEELVDTGDWLRTITNPPRKWREAIERRTDVLRSRFVRFRPPVTWPSPRSRFVVRPFKDTRIVLNARRGGIVNDSYTWSGEPEGDLAGWGNIVLRPDGHVAVSIDVNGRRFQIVNVSVADRVYAVLELRPLQLHRREG